MPASPAAIPNEIGKARWRATLQLAARTLDHSPRVLEIGATDASFREALPHASWLTIDKFGSPDIVADLDGPGASIPLPESSMDAILCTEVLEHLPSGSTLVREIGRVLTPQGVAIISVPNMVSAKARIQFAVGRIPSMAASGDLGAKLGGSGIITEDGWVAGHVVDFNHKRLKGYLLREGLQIIERQTLPFYLGRPPRDRILLPWVPLSLADYLLVAARPVDS